MVAANIYTYYFGLYDRVLYLFLMDLKSFSPHSLCYYWHICFLIEFSSIFLLWFPQKKTGGHLRMSMWVSFFSSWLGYWILFHFLMHWLKTIWERLLEPMLHLLSRFHIHLC